MDTREVNVIIDKTGVKVVRGRCAKRSFLHLKVVFLCCDVETRRQTVLVSNENIL
jgi:hypothetical protein